MIDTSTHACEPKKLSEMKVQNCNKNPLRSPNQEFIELNCVQSGNGKGSNKFYRMENLHDGTFRATYGRIGDNNFLGGARSCIWNMNMWETKYYEKAHEHGYFVVKTYKEEIKGEIEVNPPKKKRGRPKKIREVDLGIKTIVNRLLDFANKTIKKHYSIEATKITKEMVDNAERELNYLIANKDNFTIDEFNNQLLIVFAMIPRKMNYVDSYLAKYYNNKNDFDKILSREQDLLDTARGQINYNKTISSTSTTNPETNILNLLEKNSIEWTECNDEEIENIKNHLGMYKDKYVHAWRIVNKETENKFNDFVKENHMNKRSIQFLFHGTRNENLWSIITTGLKLRPNAIITGKMFGHGIYFANKAAKSMGYTSGRGSIWAKGGNDTGFLFVYKVAVGKHLDVYKHEHWCSSLNYNSLQTHKKGANSLWAHAGSMLKNDEIIIYKEEQCTIRYLIEVKM